MKDNDSEPTSYFLGDDYNSDEPVAAVALDTPSETSSHPAPVFERVPADSGSRKRLAVWALGFIGVVAAVAALLSGGGEEASLELAGDNPADGLVIARNDAVSGGLAETGPLPTDPLSVPKLVVNREAKSPQGGAAKAKDRAAAKDKERKAQAGGKRDKVVHAGPANDAPAAARQRVTAPKFEAKAPAPAAAPPKVQAPTQVQAAAGSSASAQSAAVVKKLTPAPAAPAPKPKPTLAKPVATPTPKPAPAPVAAAPKPAATPAAKPIAPTRPAAAPAPKAAPVVASAAPAAAVGGKSYTVQIGAFSSRGNAETALAKLKKTYPDGRIMVTTAGGKTVFRVVSGAFPSVPAANARANALKRGGFSTYVRAGN